MQLREEVAALVEEVAATFQQFQSKRAAAAGALTSLEAELPQHELTEPLPPLVPGPDEVRNVQLKPYHLACPQSNHLRFIYVYMLSCLSLSRSQSNCNGPSETLDTISNQHRLH